MLIAAFFANMAFEIYALVSGMPDWIYRLIFVRYLFAFGLGIWLAFGIDRKWLSIGCIISMAYIAAINYFGYAPIAQPSWGSQNALSFLWPLSIIVMGISIRQKSSITTIFRPISEIGRASYHIFLTQMVYFWAIGNFINSITWAAFIINVVLCILVGWIFFNFSIIVSAKLKELNSINRLLRFVA